MMEQFKKYSELHNTKIIFLSDKPHIDKMLKDSNLDNYFDIIAEESLEYNMPKKKKQYSNKFNLQFDMKLFS